MVENALIQVYKRLTPYEMVILKDFISYFSRLEFLDAIILYGSRSIVRSNEWSDMDLAVVVKDKGYVRKTERLIERWNIEFSPEIMVHFLVIDQEALRTTAIGNEIMKGEILWSRLPRT